MPQEPVKCPACKGIKFEMPKDKKMSIEDVRAAG
jgi:Zn finger protein HypA/HybF involved in hydrogenase expression